MIKMLFSDLDNTLSLTINKKPTIPDYNVEAVKKLSENGVKVVVNTGRFGPGAIQQLDQYGLEYDLCSSGGSALRIGEDKHLLKVYNMNVQQVINMFYDVISVTPYTRYQINVNDESMVLYENNDGHMTQEEIDEFIKKMNQVTICHKVVVRCFNMENYIKIQEKIKPLYEKYFNMFESVVTNLDITDIHCHKGTAIDDLCAYYGVKREETAGIGDGENDITILEHVGLGFAIEAGNEKLKEKANYVVKTFADAAEEILNRNRIEG